jgi:ligand-binding sensor domain-containing protein
VSRYDGKSFTHVTEKTGLCSNNVYCMLEDKAGNMWFGTLSAGVCRYDGKTFTYLSSRVPRKP